MRVPFVNRMYEPLRSMRYGLLTWRDIIERLYLRTMDAAGALKPENYMRATLEYLGIDAATAMKAISTGRDRHKNLWKTKARTTEIDYQSFYGEDKWYILHYPYYYRTMTWHFIDKLTPGPRILEYGSGPAIMTAWLSEHYTNNSYTVADLALGSSMSFLRHRFKKTNVKILEIGLGREGLPLCEEYDLIVCLSVLEHTINPDEIVEHFCDHLATRGVLFCDFMNASGALSDPLGSENLLEAVERRDRALDIMSKRLHAIKPIRCAKSLTEVVNGWDAIGKFRGEA